MPLLDLITQRKKNFFFSLGGILIPPCTYFRRQTNVLDWQPFFLLDDRNQASIFLICVINPRALGATLLLGKWTQGFKPHEGSVATTQAAMGWMHWVPSLIPVHFTNGFHLFQFQIPDSPDSPIPDLCLNHRFVPSHRRHYLHFCGSLCSSFHYFKPTEF